jgi:hemerythrin superfamily protein
VRSIRCARASRAALQASRAIRKEDGMKAIELLRKQHRDIERMLDELMDLPEDDVRFKRKRLARLGDLLAIHTALEERVFYPGVNRLSTEDLLLKSLEEHLSIKRLLADLLRLDTWDPTFAPKCTVLREQLFHHFEEEELRLFPKTEAIVSLEEREAMGEAMEKLARTMRNDRPRFAVDAQTDAAAPLD